MHPRQASRAARPASPKPTAWTIRPPLRSATIGAAGKRRQERDYAW